jgi:hypothetical protein
MSSSPLTLLLLQRNLGVTDYAEKRFTLNTDVNASTTSSASAAAVESAVVALLRRKGYVRDGDDGGVVASPIVDRVFDNDEGRW